MCSKSHLVAFGLDKDKTNGHYKALFTLSGMVRFRMVLAIQVSVSPQNWTVWGVNCLVVLRHSSLTTAKAKLSTTIMQVIQGIQVISFV